MSDIEQESAMPGEQAAEFAALEAMAQGVPQQGTQPAQQEDQQQAVPLAQEIAGALLMAANVVGPMFPSLQAIYTPDTCEKVGMALEPVCIKHGWLQDGIGGKYKEELLALAVVGPLAFATYKGVQADIAASKPKENSQVENVTLPLGQQQGPMPDTEKAEAVKMGKVIPHENG